MDKQVLGVLIGGICFVSVTTVLPVCIMYLRRGNRTNGQQLQSPVGDIVARLERMETGMETMSAEIERIGEGQRFTTRLLNDRDPRVLESAAGATRRI